MFYLKIISSDSPKVNIKVLPSDRSAFCDLQTIKADKAMFIIHGSFIGIQATIRDAGFGPGN